MSVKYSYRAVRDLDAIWNWNVTEHGIDRAEKYLAFLLSRVADLASAPRLGRSAPSAEGFYYVVASRRSRSHGHVIVYEFDAQEVTVLRFFHTAQDWERQILDLPDDHHVD